MSIELILPWPPSGNTAWRKGVDAQTGLARWHKSARYKAFIKAVGQIVLVARAAKLLDCEVHTYIEWTPPDKRRRDMSNVLKTLEDALTKNGVWRDDSQVASCAQLRLPPAAPGRARIVITPLSEVRR